ncbi:hypothetical protein M2277_005107 [Paenibacillus sp. LBL]|uniref:hypothetical protein n=1 Tax=Paenibacillus sp. LBL TaxID=2940563 RepID=UPI002476ECE6|nr:hypothetical protein [Paenibacillus sp. LBL]MDH6674415.1 hypothetical protein [Paenibacillus sp. LBL]
MKIILPDGEKKNLDEALDYENRIKVVEEILLKWNDHYRETWEMNKTKVALEVLSNYICMVKELDDKHKEDKYVMSNTKMKKLRRGDSKNTPFSSLSKEDQRLLGTLNSDEEDDW